MIVRLLIVALIVAAPAQAQSPQPARERAPISRWELPVTIAGLASALAASSLLDPANCHWCETTASGADAVNGLDRSVRNALRWSDANLGRADTLSYVTAFTPLGLVLVRRDLDGRGILTVVQALTTTSLIAQTVKIAAARERPSYRYRRPGSVDQPNDRNTSFFSGHTADAFTLLVSVAHETAARGRPTGWLWIAGVPLAAATAYFRVSADRHYLTDVIAGAGVGVAVGYGIPALQDARSVGRPTITPSVNAHGGQLIATWTW
ncbi:MAG TPA: phosphatase PAP2 family protein [Vicinamibacterales bacterium]|jgi:membrane-associated phospholipid phosphatase